MHSDTVQGRAERLPGCAKVTNCHIPERPAAPGVINLSRNSMAADITAR